MIFLDKIVDEVHQLELHYNLLLVDSEHQLQYNKREIDLIVLCMDPNHHDIPINYDDMNVTQLDKRREKRRFYV